MEQALRELIEQTDVAIKAMSKEEIDSAAHEAQTSPKNSLPQPTLEQIKAENYKKGHVDFQGLQISIENPKGSYRQGVSPDGKKWKTKINHHYGYIKGTIGRDKDHLDVFIGDNAESEQVFVVNQVDPKSKKFDEHKIMLGFDSIKDAKEAYLSNYENGWQGLGNIVAIEMAAFKEWIKSGNTKQPLTVKAMLISEIVQKAKKASKDAKDEAYWNQYIDRNQEFEDELTKIMTEIFKAQQEEIFEYLDSLEK